MRTLKIYLFRHGQTHFNRRRMFTGWKDVDWTKKGAMNALKTAKKLKNKRIDVVFHTRLKRSLHTLNTVLKYHPECFLGLIDDRMIERCYGELQGRSHEKFIREHGQELFDKYHRAYDFPPPKGESLRMIEKRVLSFIRDLLAFMRKFRVNVAISAHGNSMRPFRRYFEKASIAEMLKWEIPYDDYFGYSVSVSSGKSVSRPKRKDWKAVRLPEHVALATDRHNVLRKYY